LTVVQRHADSIVARNWDDVDPAIAKISVADFVRPVGDFVEALGGFNFCRNEAHGNRGLMHRLDARVSSDVIRM